MAVDRVLILGGGVSGLATAYFLSRYAIPATIIEKTTRTGGLIKTDFIEGCRLEAGPDSFIATKPAVSELAQELAGLKDRIIGSNDAARRIFVVRNGKLLPLPKGMVMMVPGEWGPLEESELISPEAKRRIYLETEMTPQERHEDISVGQLVDEHFGPEVLQYLTEPLLSGVYGGESEKLSAASVLPRFMGYERKYGSLVKGVREELQDKPKGGSLFLSLRDGMQTLTDSLAAAIAGRVSILRAEASAVTRSGDGWQVCAAGERLTARNVVLCCPAHVNAGLLEATAAPLAGQLAAIPYSSAILVTLVYDRLAIDHPLDGFGFLVPRVERKTIAAATWVNTKFPFRIRPDLAAIRAFIVGQRALELAQAPEEDIVRLVRNDIQSLMRISAQPLFDTFYRWPNSMPQYVVGHAERVANIFQHLNEYPGLFLGGNAYDGVGIPDCLRRAREIAQHICQNSI
jgi:protoporphyrinogen/coproporphyrinogen III oxidase